jgi:hypothetical protein
MLLGLVRTSVILVAKASTGSVKEAAVRHGATHEWVKDAKVGPRWSKDFRNFRNLPSLAQLTMLTSTRIRIPRSESQVDPSG